MEKLANCGNCKFWERSELNTEKGFGSCNELENILAFRYESDEDYNYFELTNILAPFWFYCSQHKEKDND